MTRITVLTPAPYVPPPPTCPEPDVGNYALRVYGNMEPVTKFDPANCWHFKMFVGALGEIYQQLDSLITDPPYPPWEQIVDIDRCPDYGLLWTAQLVGVRVPPKYTPDEQRAYIKGTPNWKRGTLAALTAAAQIHLTDTKAVYINERVHTAPDPAYTMQIHTLERETPDPDETLADIVTQKPAGIVLQYQVIAGQTYQHLYDTSGSYQIVYTKYATYEGVFQDEPGV